MPLSSWRMPNAGSSAHLDLGDQVADGRVPAREVDAGGLADQAAPAVAPDEVFRPQRPAVGQLDVDAGVVLREARHLAPAIDRHRQLVDPAGQDLLDAVLPQREPVVVARGKVADVQSGSPAKPATCSRLPLRRGTDRRFRADRAPRWCVTCRPRAREPARSWLARRSTMATSTPASASSPASISPVGPAPAITTACPVISRPPFPPVSGQQHNPGVTDMVERLGQPRHDRQARDAGPI